MRMNNKYPPLCVWGGISVSGKALKLQATHKVRFLLACQPRIGLLATRKRASNQLASLLCFFKHSGKILSHAADHIHTRINTSQFD